MAFTLILLSFLLTSKEASLVQLHFNFQEHATKVASTISHRQYGKLSKIMGYRQSIPATMNFDSSSANWWLWHSYRSGRSPSTMLNWSDRSPAHSLSWIVFWATLRTPGWMVGSFLLQCGVSLSRMETEQIITWRGGTGSSMQSSVDHIPTSINWLMSSKESKP